MAPLFGLDPGRVHNLLRQHRSIGQRPELPGQHRFFFRRHGPHGPEPPCWTIRQQDDAIRINEAIGMIEPAQVRRKNIKGFLEDGDADDRPVPSANRAARTVLRLAVPGITRKLVAVLSRNGFAKTRGDAIHWRFQSSGLPVIGDGDDASRLVQ